MMQEAEELPRDQDQDQDRQLSDSLGRNDGSIELVGQSGAPRAAA